METKRTHKSGSGLLKNLFHSWSFRGGSSTHKLVYCIDAVERSLCKCVNWSIQFFTKLCSKSLNVVLEFVSHKRGGLICAECVNARTPRNENEYKWWQMTRNNFLIELRMNQEQMSEVIGSTIELKRSASSTKLTQSQLWNIKCVAHPFNEQQVTIHSQNAAPIQVRRIQSSSFFFFFFGFRFERIRVVDLNICKTKIRIPRVAGSSWRKGEKKRSRCSSGN